MIGKICLIFFLIYIQYESASPTPKALDKLNIYFNIDKAKSIRYETGSDWKWLDSNNKDNGRGSDWKWLDSNNKDNGRGSDWKWLDSNNKDNGRAMENQMGNKAGLLRCGYEGLDPVRDCRKCGLYCGSFNGAIADCELKFGICVKSERVFGRSLTCKCGIRNHGNTRIVGGTETMEHEFPWQVGLLMVRHFFNTHPKCGGSIISSRTVLTAAHCTRNKKPEDINVMVGDHNWHSYDDGSVTYGLLQIIDHPNFDYYGGYLNDYSLLILNTTLIWNEKWSPVCLPKGFSSFYENVEAIVTGWGTLSFRGRQPNILQKVTVRTMTNDKCIRVSVYKASDIKSDMMCAIASNKDSCQGDSGGPLVTEEVGGYYTQIGVVSWGGGCAQSYAPGVYARVTSSIDWIRSNMQGDTCPPPGECDGKPCGFSPCTSDSRGGGRICDGRGACVSVEENPCSQHGCQGKWAGDECLMGDIIGICDATGDCKA